jgi:glutathione S-transferase
MAGAILLYLGEQDERLLPAAGQARWDAIAWLFAALNSVEPVIVRIVSYDIFHKDKSWAPDAREASLGLCRQKLKRVADALAGKDWLAGEFSIADIAMVTVLNGLRHTDLVAEYPSLAAYHKRGTERPAYKRALEAQFADFKAEAPQAA